MRVNAWSSNGHDYAFFADRGTPDEYGPTGSFIADDSMIFRGLDDYLPPAMYGQPDTWQCQYCGSKYWVEDKELKCKNCGATRDL